MKVISAAFCMLQVLLDVALLMNSLATLPSVAFPSLQNRNDAPSIILYTIRERASIIQTRSW